MNKNSKSQNEYFQNSEEIIAMDLLCRFLNIPYNEVIPQKDRTVSLILKVEKLALKL